MDYQRSPLFVPQPIVVACPHFKSVCTGIQVCKSGKSLCPHLYPIVIKALKLISILVFIARSKIDSYIMERKKGLGVIEINLLCFSNDVFQNTIFSLWL